MCLLERLSLRGGPRGFNEGGVNDAKTRMVLPVSQQRTTRSSQPYFYFVSRLLVGDSTAGSDNAISVVFRVVGDWVCEYVAWSPSQSWQCTLQPSNHLSKPKAVNDIHPPCESRHETGPPRLSSRFRQG